MVYNKITYIALIYVYTKHNHLLFVTLIVYDLKLDKRVGDNEK